MTTALYLQVALAQMLLCFVLSNQAEERGMYRLAGAWDGVGMAFMIVDTVVAFTR